MKLNRLNLEHLTDRVAKPVYLAQATRHGIAHIGVGGFHRAHQAYYTDQLLNAGRDLDWSICGIGLRDEDRKVRDDLADQDYLYTLFELDDGDDSQSRIIGSISDMLLAQDDLGAVIDKLASPDIRIVSLTITEGGYCIDDSNGEFMATLPQIQHDLAHPDTPTSVFGVLSAALARRRATGTPAFTVMSCDNLPHNGGVARKALLAYTALLDMELHDWIAAHVSFPNAMVDRITPMTSDAHRQQLHDQLGIDAPGRWCVSRLSSGCWKITSATVARPGKRLACSSPMTSRLMKR